MDGPLRELLVARIVAGVVRCRVGNETIIVGSPTRSQRYLACEIYEETFAQAAQADVWDDDEVARFQNRFLMWDPKREERLVSLTRDVEEFKVKLFELAFRSNERAQVRVSLGNARVEQATLTAQKHAYSHLSCSGVANLAKMRFLHAVSMCRTDGSPLVSEANYWESQEPLIDRTLAVLYQNRLNESEFRLLARTEPWRSIWSTRRSENGVFGKPSADLSDEQRVITVWSGLYENIAEHPERPGDEVVEDDDVLDGWMILQRRKQGSGGTNAAANKHPGAQEVYIPAETAEDARKVDSLNDPLAAAQKAQRFAHLRKVGEVNEMDMPDMRQQVRMEAAKMFSQTVKGQ